MMGDLYEKTTETPLLGGLVKSTVGHISNVGNKIGQKMGLKKKDQQEFGVRTQAWYETRAFKIIIKVWIGCMSLVCLCGLVFAYLKYVKPVL